MHRLSGFIICESLQECQCEFKGYMAVNDKGVIHHKAPLPPPSSQGSLQVVRISFVRVSNDWKVN